MKIKFVCPKCHQHCLEEVMEGVTLVSEVLEDTCESNEGELEIQYGDQVNDDGATVRYQCAECGCLVAKSNHELFVFLAENDMLELEEGDKRFTVEIPFGGPQPPRS